MNVVFVTHYAKLYGANKSMLNLIEGLARFGVNSFVISPEGGPLIDELKGRGIPVSIVPFQRDVYKPIPKGLDIFHKIYYHAGFLIKKAKRNSKNNRCLVMICELLRKWKADIVHTNSFTTCVGLLAAKAEGIPHVWQIREFGDLDYDLHPFINLNSYIRLISSSDHVICISQSVKHHFFKDIDRSNVSVIYNGLFFKDEFTALSNKFPLSRDKVNFTFIIAGVIQPSKGQMIALKAFVEARKQIPNGRLLIAGEGSTRHVNDIKEFILAHGLVDCVMLMGHLPDLLPVLGVANGALICSEHEAFGRIAVEAMACGCPVIVNNSGGLREIVTHGINGLTYHDGHLDLARQMIYLAEEPESALKLAADARLNAMKRYTIERCSKEVYNIYSSI